LGNIRDGYICLCITEMDRTVRSLCEMFGFTIPYIYI
jgi:hypothetical protein